MTDKDATSIETGLRSGDPAHGFAGRIGKTLRESEPWWPPEVRPPLGSPNVIFILLDDLGYSDFGCFGAEIDTPNIDALAAGGLRYANYTTVPMCTPARAALLTGKNPHSVGCGWLTFNTPGYPGYRAGEIASDAPTIAEILRDTGYATYAAGKWHNTAEQNISASADHTSWPLQRGFDRFYGFIGGETHYFSPSQLVEDNGIVARDDYPSDYYCTDDWTDRAIGWLKAHCAATPTKPFFLYLPYNAPHAPLQAKHADLAKYKGIYDAGWDAIRLARLKRQIALGLVAPGCELGPHSPATADWADIPEADRALMCRYMELYAAVIDNLDQNIGKLTGFLRAAGLFDNTLIVVTSDNGANGIGGAEGAANNLAKRMARTEPPGFAQAMLDNGQLGGARSWPAYPVGWTDVSSTPFRLFKTTTMNGGIRVPLIVHWPSGIDARGEIRHQWVHVTDIVPTTLDILGTHYPPQRNGYRTRTLDGVTFRPSLTDGKAVSLRSRQHYELGGNRGYILGRWKAVSLQPQGQAIDLNNWALFDLETDPTERRDLAVEHSEELRELIAAFDADAQGNYVYPLDNRDIRRGLTVPPFLESSANGCRTFYPGTDTVALAVISPLIADRDYELGCRFLYKVGDEGVLLAIGDPFAGLTWFVSEGKPWFVYNSGQGPRVVRSGPLLSAGENEIVLCHRAHGARVGTGTLRVNGSEADEIDMSPTTILGWVGEGLDVGLDRRQKVSDEYAGRGCFAYTNHIVHVRIVPGAHPPDSYANRPERESQRDSPGSANRRAGADDSAS